MDNPTPQFDFGVGQQSLLDVPNPSGTQRAQLEFPLDGQSEGALRRSLENILRDVIVQRRRVAFTIPAGAVSFNVASDYMVLTGAAAVTIATIKGGKEGQILTLSFTDGNVTITDTATGAADTVNLSAAFTSTSNDTIQLLYDGTSWRETSRSAN